MKRIAACLLLAAASIAGAADNDTPAVNGKWQIHVAIADRELDYSCDFKQTGADLAGKCDVGGAAIDVTGKVADKKVTWSYKMNSAEAGGIITMNYRGAINSASSITGFVTVEEFGVEGEFKASSSN